MLKKFAPFQVPMSWYFTNVENGWRIEGASLSDVASKVRIYRAQNEFPELEYLESVIEHYLCTRQENRGKCEDKGPLKRGVIATLKGGIVILKNLMYSSFVSNEIADARSAICKDCPLNYWPDKGPFVAWADDVASMAIGDRKSKHHDEIATCEGCSCLMRSKVWFTGPFGLTKEERQKMTEGNPSCWQLKEK